MATCCRCETVTQRNGDGIGVCMECQALACRLDGERDATNLDFYCGMCMPHRLTLASGLPGGPADPDPPDDPGDPDDSGDEPGGGDTPSAPRPPGGAAVQPFDSSADFARRFPVLAEQTLEHRMLFLEQVDTLIEDFQKRGRGAEARALQTVRTAEWDPDDVGATTRLLADQITAAEDRGAFDPELFADALGVAAWSVGIRPGADPHVAQLRRIGDARLQVGIAISRIAARP